MMRMWRQVRADQETTSGGAAFSVLVHGTLILTAVVATSAPDSSTAGTTNGNTSGYTNGNDNGGGYYDNGRWYPGRGLLRALFGRRR